MKKLLLIALILTFSNIQAGILDLKITEIMYHPKTDVGQTEKTLEFIEIKNTGIDTLNLRGLIISGGIQFIFSNDFKLAPDSFCVLSSNTAIFNQRYPGVKVDGQFSSNLANSGEDLIFRSGLDTIFDITYNDNLPWPPLADGNGFSLVPTETNPTGPQKKSYEWTNSCNINGSPREDDPGCSNNKFDIWINELISHTDLPEVDAIEIYNNENSEVDISNWFLSDSRSNPFKYQIPANTKIPAKGYYVIDESSFNPNGTGFRFNRSGDEIFLCSGNDLNELTGFATGWEFDAQYNGVSFGVYINSQDENHFVAQNEKSFGSMNSTPKIGPLVITDINYNPGINESEYVIIKNITDSIISCWHPATPDSGWAVSGIKFQFPAGVTIDPNEFVVLTKDLPNDLRQSNDIPDTVQIFQYTGKLSNSGENLAIWSYDRMDTTGSGSTFMPRVLMDNVDYSDDTPWSPLADGYGYSLRRKVNNEYGNDPENWETASYRPENTQFISSKTIDVIITDSYLKINDNSGREILIELYNSEGKLVTRGDLTFTKQLSIGHLKPGIYLYTFSINNRIVSGKIIK